VTYGPNCIATSTYFVGVSFQASREHITPEVLDAFLKLTAYLVELPTGSTLLKHLFDHILFNPALWIYATVEVSEALHSGYTHPSR
jgi:hypothetical protein